MDIPCYLFRDDVTSFINLNIGKDVVALALNKNPFPGTDWQMILSQITGKAKAKEKLPTWYNTPGIVWPTKISLEQSSSEITAEYKASLVSGRKLADLTGGFGVDDFYFSSKVTEVIHCELDPTLSAIANHNFRILGASVETFSGDSSEYLQNCSGTDWIYVDPSRRNEAKGKVFMLSDCLPNVPENLDFYFSKADNIMVKTSPLLDISSAMSELRFVRKIHIIAVANEVKELLWILEKDYSGSVDVYTVNFGKETQKFNFELTGNSQSRYSLPSKYLYEPNAAIMKSGGFDEVGVALDLAKLHRNTHLYTSETISEFPGRIFAIEEIVPFKKSNYKKLAELKKANITLRNFPGSVADIRKKLKITDGGGKYCFFTTDKNDDKIVLICSKLPS